MLNGRHRGLGVRSFARFGFAVELVVLYSSLFGGFDLVEHAAQNFSCGRFFGAILLQSNLGRIDSRSIGRIIKGMCNVFGEGTVRTDQTSCGETRLLALAPYTCSISY